MLMLWVCMAMVLQAPLDVWSTRQKVMLRAPAAVSFLEVHQGSSSWRADSSFSALIEAGVQHRRSLRVNMPSKVFKFKHKASGDDFWHGTEGASSTITLHAQQFGERKAVHGSIVDQSTGMIYKISQDGNGETFVKARATSDFPPESDPLVEGPVPELSLLGVPGQVPKAQSGEKTVLDVLVAWTKVAECHSSHMDASCSVTSTTEDNMKAKAQLAARETNLAYEASGINAELRVVHMYRLQKYTHQEHSALDKAIGSLRRGDENMTDVLALRDQHRADFVHVIEHAPETCGLAFVGPSKDTMYSASHWDCTTGYYSFGHEIAHNMGCSHDRETEGKCSPNNETAYGWRDPDGKFRDIMSYDCKTSKCGNASNKTCTRVMQFSSADHTYQGKPLGDAHSDCAARLNAVKDIVAAYY